MRPPLIRAGEGPAAAYAMAQQQRTNHEHAVARALVTNNAALPQPHQTYGLGDARQLRGIPAVGVKGGLGGAITGTRPDSYR